MNGVVPTGNFLFRKNDGVTVDHVYYDERRRRCSTLRGGWQRFQEPNVRQHEGLLRSGDARLPAVGHSALFGGASISRTSTSISSPTSATTSPRNDHAQHLLVPADLSRGWWAAHSVRAGYDMRLYREFGSEPGPVRRVTTYAQQRARSPAQQDNSTALFGQDIASFLLGHADGRVDRAQRRPRLNSTMYHGMFVQDDWKLSNAADGQPRAALRVRRRRRPIPENRNVRGFDPPRRRSASPAPREGGLRAQPRSRELPVVCVPRQRGGLQFATDAQSRLLESPTRTTSSRAPASRIS